MDGLGETLPVVPLNEWTREVDALSANTMGHELGNIVRINLPLLSPNTYRPSKSASQLMGTFSSSISASVNNAQTPEGRSTMEFETSRLVASSMIAQNIQPISEEHATMWIKYWQKAGYIE